MGHERPGRPAGVMFPRPPTRNAKIHEVIQFAQGPPADTAEILTSAPDVSIEVPDGAIEAPPRVLRALSHFIADAPQRLGTYVEIQP